MYDIVFFSNSWQPVSALLVFLLGLLFSIFIARKLLLSDRLIIGLYFYHTMFCVVYFIYSHLNASDSNMYFYSTSLDVELTSFKVGTTFVRYFVRFFHYLDFSKFGVFLVFNFIGFVGLVLYYSALKSVTLNSSSRVKILVILSIFLPSISFWSSAIGKDAISFLAVGLALYSAVNFNSRILLFICALILMLLVRPHMAGVMIIAILVSIVLQKEIAVIPRFFIGSIGLVVAVIMIPFALNYAGLDQNASNIESYIETRQGYNQQGGGGIDISSMSLPEKMFTYLARPLPFEAKSITQLLASLDNMLILYILLMGVVSRLKSKKLKLIGNRVFMWWYTGASWVILSMTTSNLGIAVRQKWMFVPILTFLLISIISAIQEKKN
ncbi:hypothetical protein AB6C54_10145 [Vibrio splendidus]